MQHSVRKTVRVGKRSIAIVLPTDLVATQRVREKQTLVVYRSGTPIRPLVNPYLVMLTLCRGTEYMLAEKRDTWTADYANDLGPGSRPGMTTGSAFIRVSSASIRVYLRQFCTVLRCAHRHRSGTDPLRPPVRVVICIHMTTRTQRPDAVLSVRTSRTTHARLGQLAKATRRTRSALANEALEQYVAHQEWLAHEIERGIEAANKGDLVSDSAVRAWIGTLEL